MIKRVGISFLLAWALVHAGCQANAPAVKNASAADPHVLITFCAMGDMPYEPGEPEMMARQLAELPAEARFVLHVGDIQKGPGTTRVTEARYIQVAEILKKSPKPLFIIPGDNEYNDAPNVADAWQYWTRNLLKMHENWNYPVTRQAERVENFAWVDGRVLFVAVNLVGGRVHDRAEWAARHQQDVDWIRKNLEQHKNEVHCAVVFGHANPAATHRDFMAGFLPAAAAFEKPLLFIHGDGHKWILDRPYASPTRGGGPPAFAGGAPNIVRVQVDMGGIAPPIKVTVTDDPKEPFHIDRRLPASTATAPAHVDSP